MTLTGSSLAGELLDRRYRVDRLLARGGMSSVYRGVDTRLDRPVAIKIMDSRFADDRTFVDRFEREARSAARLHHPHVVAVHDQGFDTSTGPEDKRAFLVMELVDGGTLRGLLNQRGALDVPLALAIFEQVLSALAAAHAAGLVHRDIKPENILIGRGDGTSSGTVKVGDFGLVRAIASAGTTSTSVILGTVAYLSPEQVTTGSAEAQGDVYSAGILLYEMLTGQVPYTGDTALSVAYQHVNNDVPPPSHAVPELQPELDDLVVRATRRDARLRPADAGVLLAELGQVRAQLGVSPVPVPIPPPPGQDVSDPEATAPAMPVPDTEAAVAGPRGTQALPRESLLHTATGQSAPEPPPDQPRARRTPWIALWVLVGLLLAGGLGTGAWWFTQGRWVDIPRVTGMDREQAGQVLRQAELTPAFTEERHNTTASGTVIRTDPGDGERAMRGAEVVVVVSLGRPIVPDITPGTSVEQAEQAIRAVELQPRRDSEADQYSTDVPEGAVVTVQPSPGSQANVGDKVTLILSKGDPPEPIPDVVGNSQDQAFQALRDAGFEPYEAGVEFSPDVPSGHVIRTEPAGGDPAEEGTRVGVYLSDSVEVPAVLGMPAREAVQILTEAGFDVANGDRRGRFSFVIGQDPMPGTLVESGTTVTLTTIP